MSQKFKILNNLLLVNLTVKRSCDLRQEAVELSDKDIRNPLMGKLDCMNEDIVQAGLQGLLLPWSALLWGGLGVDGSRFKTPEFNMKHPMEMLKMHNIVNHNQLGLKEQHVISLAHLTPHHHKWVGLDSIMTLTYPTTAESHLQLSLMGGVVKDHPILLVVKVY